MVENREYLAANYTDPSFVKGMIVVIVMVVLAGILTIYSIYYVSMIPKVQEYGKLKAIGSTKRQIRQMVFREGMLVTALALPVGLLISSFLSRWNYETDDYFYGRRRPSNAGSSRTCKKW